MNKLEALRLIRWILKRCNMNSGVKIALKLYDEYMETK